MVKIIRKFALLDPLKEAYHKPLWGRLKHLWSTFRNSNQAVASYLPLSAIVCLPLSVIIVYGKLYSNPVPRYFDHIRIYRPDDSRVANIRKDSTLKYGESNVFDSIHMPNTI
ncbi:uncharacterized protein LOC132916409 [Bombus pascuorum]|uniref:uncharacterized protein LOC132916409 n=1 Tax=Bombus pascuorum TaxID=65598 RepID=UPI002125221E|nr:uncharacterized protein LOC132916409 [Bombus pascuorum]